MGITIEKQQEMINRLVQKLLQIRKGMGVSQSELGKRIGLSRQSISSIERGIVSLIWNTMLSIILFIIVNEPDYIEKMRDDDTLSLIIDKVKKNS